MLPYSLAPRRAAALSPGRFPTAGCLWEERALLWPAVRSPGGAVLTKATAPQPAPLAAASLCSTLSREETPRGPCSALEAPGWSLGSVGWGGRGGDRSSLSLPPRPHRLAPDQGQHLLRCRHMRILCWAAAGRGGLGPVGWGSSCLSGSPGLAGVGGGGSESVTSPDPMTPGMCTCALISACVCVCACVCTYVSWGEGLAGLCPKLPSRQGRWD